MAELLISVSYKTPNLKTGYIVMCILFPVWTIFLPTILGLLISNLLSSSIFISQQLYYLSFISIGFLIILGFVCTAITDETDLVAQRKGLILPIIFMPMLGFRRKFDWSSLIKVDCVETQSEHHYLVLQINGSKICLDRMYLNKRQLEEFLLAIDIWAPQCEKSSSTVEMQNSHYGALNEENGYTQIWEDELSRRFHSTSFIPLEAGSNLQEGKYLIVRQVAFGGLCAVYLAQKDRKELVVLKEAVVPVNATPEARRLSELELKRECQMLFCLYHPSIARVLDYFIDDDRHYLVLEYVRGQDLKQFVSQHGAQDAKRVIDWGIQIASILEFLHEQSPPIIHRDLSPDNLIIKSDGTIVLIDFGVSNEFLGTATGTLVGKQCFIAPEQLRGKAKVQSDLYALGGTLHYFLTAINPVPLSECSPLRFRDNIDPRLDSLIRKLTAFELNDRPPSAQSTILSLKKLTNPRDESYGL